MRVYKVVGEVEIGFSDTSENQGGDGGLVEEGPGEHLDILER